ncbi:MAG: PilZ domain-containing protein [Myxococcota bacterium]|nr:PilZ domain-containing protein [Myxococcota bacterium]
MSYKSPESLLGEFTRSIGKGVVALETARKLPVGTQFIFELHLSGVAEPVEVLGEVVQVTTSAKGKHLLAIRYDPTGERRGVDAVLRKIFEAHKNEKIRQFPRIPLQLRATEDTPYSPSYLVRDVSRGGVGLEVEAPSLPKQVKMGAPFLLELWISLGTLMLHGEVVWAFAPPTDRAKWVNPSFGVTFGKLRQDTLDRLDRLLVLRGLPPPPWKARVSFGMDAVSRMP